MSMIALNTALAVLFAFQQWVKGNIFSKICWNLLMDYYFMSSINSLKHSSLNKLLSNKENIGARREPGRQATERGKQLGRRERQCDAATVKVRRITNEVGEGNWGEQFPRHGEWSPPSWRGLPACAWVRATSASAYDTVEASCYLSTLWGVWQSWTKNYSSRKSCRALWELMSCQNRVGAKNLRIFLKLNFYVSLTILLGIYLQYLQKIWMLNIPLPSI